MTRREVLDDFLRQRAVKNGAKTINGLFINMEMKEGPQGPTTLHYKDFDAGECDYAVAFQERIKISPEQMKYYENLAEMYVGEDVSPDFYGWVFPKYDHVGVGTGSVMDKTGIRKYQTAIR